MTPEQALARREARIDALIERVESGAVLTDRDWRRFDVLAALDLASVGENTAREILEREREADGIDTAAAGD